MPNMNEPHPLTNAEWEELSQLENVRLSWGMEDGEGAEWLKENTYACRFDYSDGMAGPGGPYVGPLYILHADNLQPPFRFIRVSGKLELLDYEG